MVLKWTSIIDFSNLPMSLVVKFWYYVVICSYQFQETLKSESEPKLVFAYLQGYLDVQRVTCDIFYKRRFSKLKYPLEDMYLWYNDMLLKGLCYLICMMYELKYLCRLWHVQTFLIMLMHYVEDLLKRITRWEWFSQSNRF